MLFELVRNDQGADYDVTPLFAGQDPAELNDLMQLLVQGPVFQFTLCKDNELYTQGQESQRGRHRGQI